jgi:hypothetical protein
VRDSELTSDQQNQVFLVLAKLLPDWAMTDGPNLTYEMLIRAGGVVARYGGAIVLAMREERLSDFQIHEAIGIDRGIADRWVGLFLAEGGRSER